MAEAPQELMADPDLPPRAKVAAAVMWRMVRRDSGDPQWWQTFAELAEQMGCTERQARRAHYELCKHGWGWRKRHGHIFRTHLLRGRSAVAAVVLPADSPPDPDRLAAVRRAGTDRLADTGCPLSGDDTDRSPGYEESPEQSPEKSPDITSRQAALTLVVDDAAKPANPIGELWSWFEQECIRRGFARKRRGLSSKQRTQIQALAKHIRETLQTDLAGAVESQREHLAYRLARATGGDADTRKRLRSETPWRAGWWNWWQANVADAPQGSPAATPRRMITTVGEAKAWQAQNPGQPLPGRLRIKTDRNGAEYLWRPA